MDSFVPNLFIWFPGFPEIALYGTTAYVGCLVLRNLLNGWTAVGSTPTAVSVRHVGRSQGESDPGRDKKKWVRPLSWLWKPFLGMIRRSRRSRTNKTYSQYDRDAHSLEFQYDIDYHKYDRRGRHLKTCCKRTLPDLQFLPGHDPGRDTYVKMGKQLLAKHAHHNLPPPPRPRKERRRLPVARGMRTKAKGIPQKTLKRKAKKQHHHMAKLRKRGGKGRGGRRRRRGGGGGGGGKQRHKPMYMRGKHGRGRYYVLDQEGNVRCSLDITDKSAGMLGAESTDAEAEAEAEAEAWEATTPTTETLSDSAVASGGRSLSGSSDGEEDHFAVEERPRCVYIPFSEKS